MAPTPLLDRETPLPAPAPPGRGSRIITIVSAAVVFAIVMPLVVLKPTLVNEGVRALYARFPDVFARPWTMWRVLVIAASSVFGIVAVIVLHESAHVAAGLLARRGVQARRVRAGHPRAADAERGAAADGVAAARALAGRVDGSSLTTRGERSR